MIALLGRADTPTDAVEEYCRYLGEGLVGHGFLLAIERVAWNERGWRSALSSLRSRAQGWRGRWVLVQYTALAWSARGFPRRFLRVLRILRAAGVRIGVVYHDVEPYSGARWIDRIRRRVQLHVMREATRLSDAAVFTVPLEKVSWIKPCANAVFIPVGANLPTTSGAVSRRDVSSGGKLSVAVYGITGGASTQREIEEIVEAVRFAAAQVKDLRLVVLGRNSKEAETELRKRMTGIPVELEVLGVLSSDAILRSLSSCDVLLFVRGHISSGRGSAIAGIACGLPVIASEGPQTAALITEAGVAFYSRQKRGDLGEVLLRVLNDEHYRASLAQRSCLAQQRYFSWAVIAAQYAELLQKQHSGHSDSVQF